ncbi:MAG: CHAT domain-containing protein, partial [bacterium]
MNISGLNIQDQPDTTIYLRISFEPQVQELKVDLEERRQGEEITLQRYIRTKVCLTTLQSLSQEIYSILYRSTRFSGKSIKGIMESLQQVGRQLYDAVLPLEIKERLAATGSKNMHLTIDDSLVGIPWELLYDGEEFFCLKFNIGRKVYTQHPGIQPKTRDACRKLKILIIADPRNDLPKSYQEGLLLSRKLETWRDSVEVYLGTSYIDIKKISREIFHYDIIHYAGHATYNHDKPNLSGWLLEDGIFTAQDIIQLSGGKNSFPGLIFSNACRSGQTSEWSGIEEKNGGVNPYAFDMVNAFLRCGVKHYIGTFQVIRDLSSHYLASNFYNFMIQSYSIGESLRKARHELINQYGNSNLIWAYYMLYGDPTIYYLRPMEKTVRERDKDESVLQIAPPDHHKGTESLTNRKPIDVHSYSGPHTRNGTNSIMGALTQNEGAFQGAIHE